MWEDGTGKIRHLRARRACLLIWLPELNLLCIKDGEDSVHDHDLVVVNSSHGESHNHHRVQQRKCKYRMEELDQVHEIASSWVFIPEILILNSVSQALGSFWNRKVKVELLGEMLSFNSQTFLRVDELEGLMVDKLQWNFLLRRKRELSIFFTVGNIQDAPRVRAMGILSFINPNICDLDRQSPRVLENQVSRMVLDQLNLIPQHMIFKVSPIHVNSEILIIPSLEGLRHLLPYCLPRILLWFVQKRHHLLLELLCELLLLLQGLVSLFFDDPLWVIWIDWVFWVDQLCLIDVEQGANSALILWFSIVFVQRRFFLEDVCSRDIERDVIFEALHLQAQQKSVIFLQEVLLVIAVGD